MNESAGDDIAPLPRSFASDNWAGAHPEVLEAIGRANTGHAPSYGADPWTERFSEIVRSRFGPEALAFPVTSGSGANVLALQSVLPRWGGVVCADTSHINTSETGAPEKTGGLKLLTSPSDDGKLTTDAIDGFARLIGNTHQVQPLAVSLTQATEWGTVYSAREIADLAAVAHAHGMLVHIDGSRLANAAVHLGCDLGDLTEHADILSLGGTKNGLLGAEAVIVLRPDAAPGIEYLRKTVLQLSSKMRFVSAQLVALFEGDLWHRSASHANGMAARLATGLRGLEGSVPGIRVVQQVQSNVVFAELPPEVAAHARSRYAFGDWNDAGVVRLMCAFDTTEGDVEGLLDAIAEGAKRSGSAPITPGR